MFKIVTAFFLLLHATIHLMGFVKAFELVKVEQIHKHISKSQGVIWLIVFIAFFLTAFFFLLHKNWWWLVCVIGAFVSQCLIIIHWQDAKYGTVLNTVFILLGIVQFATWKYHHQYEKEVIKQISSTESISNQLLTEAHIKDLPEHVKKYIRYTGFINKPIINNFKIEFSGKLRKNDQSEWMPFTSEQYNTMNLPVRLFFMNAFMKHLPVAGYHCYNNGTAFMDIRLLSLFQVQYAKGKEMDEAETVTFFNDMCCLAPGTLIDKRIQWISSDSNSVKASFTNNNITVSAWLYFNEKGELVNFISNDRHNVDAGKKLPWATPLKEYKLINGFKLAGYAEAIYTYPDKDLCYGTFNVTNVKYNCTKESL